MKNNPLIHYLTVTSLLLSLIVSCTPSKTKTKSEISPVPSSVPPQESTETKSEISPVPSSVPPPESVALSESVQAKIALAQHLKQEGATMYGVYWCGYCRKQRTLFGEEAISILNEVECDPNGNNPRSDLCIQNNVTSYPTWQINGQLYKGLHSLDDLADLSGYQGNRNWE